MSESFDHSVTWFPGSPCEMLAPNSCKRALCGVRYSVTLLDLCEPGRVRLNHQLHRVAKGYGAPTFDEALEKMKRGIDAWWNGSLFADRRMHPAISDSLGIEIVECVKSSYGSRRLVLVGTEAGVTTADHVQDADINRAYVYR